MSMRGKQPYFARDSWPLMLSLLLAALLLFKLVGPWWSLPLWLMLSVCGFLYRDPQRKIPPLPLAVVSPVDARVVFVKKDYDPYLQRQSTHLRLQIHPLGIFGLRSPIEGKVLKQWLFKAGTGKVALHLEQAEDIGHHYVVWIQTDEDDDVVMIVHIPQWWQRLQSYLYVGERVGQGQRCGRTRFGGYVDIFMPENVRLEVCHDDRLMAGVSVLATLIHK